MTNLRCHVVGSTTERSGAVLIINVLLAHTEVGDFNVTVFVQQHVVQFQIPANHTALYSDGRLLQLHTKLICRRDSARHTDTKQRPLHGTKKPRKVAE